MKSGSEKLHNIKSNIFQGIKCDIWPALQDPLRVVDISDSRKSETALRYNRRPLNNSYLANSSHFRYYQKQISSFFSGLYCVKSTDPGIVPYVPKFTNKCGHLEPFGPRDCPALRGWTGERRKQALAVTHGSVSVMFLSVRPTRNPLSPHLVASHSTFWGDKSCEEMFSLCPAVQSNN